MKNKKLSFILILIIVNIFAKLSVEIQNKFTNLNPFPTIDIGADTNQIKTEIGIDLDYGTTNDGVFYFSKIIYMDKEYFNIPIETFKKFMWNVFTIGSADSQIIDFAYSFGEQMMDFQDLAIVRSQTNYEQKLPLVMKYFYNKHGTNYQIMGQVGEYLRNPSIKDMVDPIIYWEKNDGKVYSFTYTRMSKVSVNHLPLYTYRGFKNKTDFDNFIKIRNGESLPSDAPSLSILTTEHKALEKQYGLLD